MSILVTIYAMLYGYLAWKRLDVALWILIFALPSYLIRFTVFSIPSTILELMILIIFSLWFLKEKIWQLNFSDIIKQKTDRASYPFRFEILAVLFISIFAVIFGWESGPLGIWKAYFLEPLFVLIISFNIFIQRYQKYQDAIAVITPAIYALVLSAVTLSILAITQKITGFSMPIEWINTGRATSVFPYPNALGLYLAPIIFLSFSLALHNRRANKIISLLLVLSALLSVIAIFYAQSDGAILAISICGLLFALLYTKLTRALAIIGISATALFIFFTPAWHAPIIEKITLQDLSGQIRLLLWQETWQMLINSRLITGAGLNNFQQSLEPYHVDGLFFNKDKDPDFQRKIILFDEKYKNQYWQPVEIYLYPHNIILNFWSELGFFGMLIFAWIFCKLLWLNLKNFLQTNTVLYLGFEMAFLTMIIQGIFDVPYFKNDLAMMFWVLISMNLALLEIQKKRALDALK